MDFLGTILWPIKWMVELILVGWHWLFTTIGLNPDDGLTWVLSIVGLVIVIRAALIPIFVKQIKAQRRMLEVAPELKKIQDKYRGKKDQFSREAMSRETMALYKNSGTNPLSSCLPLLIQMPIFFGLFSVLNDAARETMSQGVGLLSAELARSFGEATIFWGTVPLHDTFVNSTTWQVKVVAAIMIVVMTASQFITQLQIVSKNTTDAVKESPTYRQQRIMLYILPLVFVFSGLAFPLGVMFYWLTTNIWTMGQQFIVIRSMPTPGSEAFRIRQERLRKKGKLTEEEEAKLDAPAKTGQRVQPVSKNRAKKQGGPVKNPNQATPPVDDVTDKPGPVDGDTGKPNSSKDGKKK